LTPPKHLPKLEEELRCVCESETDAQDDKMIKADAAVLFHLQQSSECWRRRVCLPKKAKGRLLAYANPGAAE